MTPAPSTVHQTVSKRLQYQLYTQIELAGLGVVFNAPVDVQLTDHDIVQPDLVVVLKGRESIIAHAKINGVPDLVVEILSPSTTRSDTALKKSLYQRAGVSEYWIVDPDGREIQQYRLVDGVFHQVPYAEPLLGLTGMVQLCRVDAW